MAGPVIFKGKLAKFLTKLGILIPKRPTTDRSGTPEQGETAFNTTDSKLEVYDGTAWVQLGAGGGEGVGLSHPTTNSTYESGTNNPSMSGTGNTAIGVDALNSVDFGDFNTAFGYRAGDALTSGGRNTIVGSNAGRSINVGYDNVLVGSQTGDSITSGERNIAVGQLALQSCNTGTGNVAIGDLALSNTTGGSFNVAIGTQAGFFYSSASQYNTVINAVGLGSSASRFGTVAIGSDSDGAGALAVDNNDFVLGTLNHRYKLPGTVYTILQLGPIGTSTGNGGQIRFYELAANGEQYVTLRAPDSLSSLITLTLPSTSGSNGQVLATNGSGVLSFVDAVSSTETITSGGYAISSSALNTQTTSYLLQSSDNGRIVLINSATAVNVTVPAGLPVGFNCSVIQIGAGQVTLVASGTTLNSANGLKISAQHGAASIISYSTNVYNVSGNTAV